MINPAEAPHELNCQISVLLVFIADWQKNIYASSWEVPEPIHCCFITKIIARFADCQLCKLTWLTNQKMF